MGSISKLKPFYVQTATEQEKESCLCKFCLNCRLNFKALVKHLKDVVSTDSQTEYFGHGIHCHKGPNGYFQDNCISAMCDNEVCSPNTMKYSLDDFHIPEHVEYYQYVKEVFHYTSKKTKEKKEGSRTVRKTFTDDFVIFKELLIKLGHLI